MATTMPMLAPDGTSGDIPQANVQAALKAGFKPAVQMTAPDGSNGYIPAEKLGDARNAGFKDVQPQQAGFWENLGHTFGVGSQEDAQRMADFKAHPIQSMVEGALGPAYSTGKAIVQGALRSGGEIGQAHTDMLAGNAPSAALHAINAIPLVGPALNKMADEAPPTTPGQSYASRVLSAATPGNVGTAVGTAAQVAPMVLSAADAAVPGRPSTIPPSGGSGGPDTPTAPSAARLLASRLLPSLVDGSPEDLMTRAVKPGKNNTGWNNDVQTALPLMKSAEADLGHPVAGVDDALQAAQSAKKNIWNQYQQRLSAGGQMGAAIDGNQIADAMMQSIDKRTAVQNPGLVQKIQTIADTYRRPLPLTDAEDFLQSANKDLNSYYAKNKVGQNVALNDPEMASTVAEASALREQLYNKLDSVSGPGAAQLKQAYGSLTNVQKELYGRQLVAARQNPESLSEQLGTISGAGRIAKGVFTLNPGDVVEGAQNIAVSRMLKARNTSDAMISRAFEAAQPAQPFPAPASPRFAGLLPRGAIQIPPAPEAGGTPAGYQPPPIDATTQAMRMGRLLPAEAGNGPYTLPNGSQIAEQYEPSMTSGEKLASGMHRINMLMEYLRQNPQIKLPPLQ